MQSLLTAIAELKNAGVCELSIEIKVVKDKPVHDDLKSYSPPPSKPMVLTAEQQAMFDKAIAAGLMERLDDGYYHWHKTKALLTYFCGRLFCGDSPKGNIWKGGRGKFPKMKLEKLFGLDNLGVYRRNRLELPLPKLHKIVDVLWQ